MDTDMDTDTDTDTDTNMGCVVCNIVDLTKELEGL